MRESTHLRYRRALRWPSLHFALVGGLLFAGEAALRTGELRTADEPPRLEVSDQRVRALIAQHERIGIATVIRCKQNAVTTFERLPEA